MKNAFRSFLLVVTMLMAGTVAYSQVTTASLGGRIVDTKGETIIGAAVVATHTPSGTTYGAVTNGEGLYTIQGMRTGGPYTVEVSCLGYQTVQFTDITLALGENYVLDGYLNDDVESLSESVVVASRASRFSAVKTGASTNISNSQMQALPMVNRSISDIAKYSPYANGMSFAGGDGRSTNFTVDGANFNNNFGLSDALPGGGNPISLDAIEEVQVVIAPFDVRQTNFIGGGVNAITKSGTNTFRGSVYTYFQNQDTRGNKINGEDLGARPQESKTVYGVTLGGPIIKNKLFFFVNYEQTKEPGQVIKFHGNSGDEVVKGNVSRTTLADLEAVQKYMMDKYGYDTGSYTDFPGDKSNRKFLARIDWNIVQGHRLSLRYNFTKNTAWNAPNGNSSDTGYRLNGTYRVGNQSMAFANNMYSQDNNVQSWSLDYNARLSDKVSHQLLATFSNIEDIRGSKSSPFPHVDIIKKADDGKSWQPYMSLGYELFTWNNGVHNKVWTVKDDVTILAGAHKIIAGVNYEHQFANNAYMRNGAGYYRYAWTDEETIIDVLNGTPESFAVTYGWNGNLNPNAQVTFSQLGVYAQDEWTVSNKLKLTYGIRLDDLIFNNDDIATNLAILNYDFRDGAKIDTGIWPKNRVQVSPRVGFVWDVYGDKSLKVRGGTGLFQGRLPLVYFTNMPTNAGLVQNSVQYKSTWDKGQLVSKNSKLDIFNSGMITSVDEMISKLGLQKELTDDKHVAGGTMSGVDRNFHMPQIWKTSLAMDWAVPTEFPFNVTVEGMFNKTVYGVVVDNINIVNNTESWSRFTGVDNRLIYPADKGYINAGKNAPYLTNTNKGYGYTGNVMFNMEPVKDLRLMASYTYTEQKEVSGLPGSDPLSTWQGLITVDGPNFAQPQRSQYVVPHKVIASVNYEIPFVYQGLTDLMQFSLFYTGMSSAGYSYCYSNDMNGDGINNDLMYIYPSGKDINWKSDAEESAKAYDAFVAQDKYLSAHKGQYAEAYAARAPWVHRFDFRWAHNFKFKTGAQEHNFQLSMDVLNIGNMFNSKWGVYKNSAICNNSRFLNFEGRNEAGEPIFSMSKNGEGNYLSQSYDYIVNQAQCWQIQFGLKYFFN